MENKKVQTKNRILKFEQPSEYYSRRALRQLEKSDLWGALASLRSAAEKAPEKSAYRLDIAEIMSQMGLYELANELLFYNIISGAGNEAACFYSLASNFFALRQTKLCKDCAANYLQREPDGLFAQDCEDMVFLLEQDEAERDFSSAAVATAEEGKRALDEGRHAEAIRKLKSALRADKSLAYARNNLALAYFCSNKVDEAISETGKVLEADGDDVFALCNMALFLNSRGKRNEARDYLSRAAKQDGLGDEEIYKLCITSADLGLHEDAAKYSGDILKFSPYDENVLYLHALSQHNCGNPLAAYRTISKLLLLEPHSAIYQHVMKLISLSSGETAGLHEIDYAFSLPTIEAIDRFDEIRRFMQLSRDAAASRLDGDRRLLSTVLWCFSLENHELKCDLAMYLALLPSRVGTLILLSMLVSLEQSDDFKRTVVMALSAREKSETAYMAIIEDSLAEIRPRKALPGDTGIPESYERVLCEALEYEGITEDSDAAMLAIHLWLHYMLQRGDSEKPLPAVKGERGWSAALVYAALKLSGLEADEREIAARYRTRASAILERYKIFETIAKEHDLI